VLFRLLVLAGMSAGGLLLTACAEEPVSIDVPTARGAAARQCSALHARLPGEVDDRSRVKTHPASDLTAAWGSPPVALRCGVPRPQGLKPTSEILEVNGVEWFLRESARGYAFTSVGRAVNVEVLVPPSVDRTEATAPLVDVADAVGQVPPAQTPSAEG